MKTQYPKEILKHKTTPWKYEKEWRFIDKCVKVKIGEITSVYFGLRMEPEKKEEIINLIEGKIPWYETEVNFQEDRIKLKDN